MTITEFKNSLSQNLPPEGISSQMQALWYDGKGDWKSAHDLADGPADKLSARIHAYLHRKEGDIWNADYWYRRAGENRPNISLEEEWELLVERIINK